MENTDKRTITSILVDTSAFRDSDFDYIGIKSLRLPAFFSAIKEKNIRLLSHPILENEIEKHIPDSSLCKDFYDLQKALKKSKHVLDKVGLSIAEAESIVDYDFPNMLFESYKKYYRDAIILEYTDPQDVFNKYFNCLPPFSSTGKKKHEFPDAFVIQSTTNYLRKHPKDVLMVVSKDNDWKSAFDESKNVIICKSINEATDYINSIKGIVENAIIESIFNKLKNDIIREAQIAADSAIYDYPDFDYTEQFELDEIEVKAIDDHLDLMALTRESILIETKLTIYVSGYGEVIDEERSYWSSEDKNYVLISYADLEFENGLVEADCEIEISYDFDNPIETAKIVSVNIIGEPLLIDCDDIVLIPIDEDELAIRTLREDMNLNRKPIVAN